MSRTLWYCFLDFRYCLLYRFIYLLCIICFWSLSLDTADFENLQELEDHVEPMLFLPLVHI
jgi:hypothetical protein